MIVIYHSFSGNTKDLAELISTQLGSIPLYRINKYTDEVLPNLSQFDKIILGTFTWGQGEIPNEVRKFVKEHQQYFQEKEVYLFGTGDTQFGGDELFCSAVDVLNRIIKSPIEPLKIEQHYQGSQEQMVIDWCNRIKERG